MYDLFISFATKGGLPTAKKLSKQVTSQLLLSTYIANQENSSGKVSDTTKSAIQRSRCVLAILTPLALKSEWVKDEIRYATQLGKPVFLCIRHDLKSDALEEPFDNYPRHPFKTVDDLFAILVGARDVEWRMPVVIPCGGEGSGLFPFSMGMPKTLFPVREKPILHHIIDKLDTDLFSKVIILAGRFQPIVDYYVNTLLKPDLEVDIRGTSSKHSGTTLPGAIASLGLKTRFMIHFSDIVIEHPFTRRDWKKVVGFHRANVDRLKILGTLLTSRKFRLDVGRITQHDEHHELIGNFVEKPEETMTDSVNIAVSIFEPEFLKYITHTDTCLYGGSLKKAMKKHRKFAHYGVKNWLHIQTLSNWHPIQSDYFQ